MTRTLIASPVSSRPAPAVTSASAVTSAPARVSRERALAILLAFFLVLGVGVRLRQYLQAPSYWYDEAYLLVNVQERGFAELVGPLRAQVVMPPAYLWLMRALYLVGGGSELVMRLPALLFGCAGLVMIYLLARRLLTRGAALVVLGLAAVSHHGMMQANVVRPYTVDFFFTCLILWAAAPTLRAAADSARPREQRPRERRPRGLMVLLLLAAAAPWLSFPSAFVLASAWLALAVRTWQCRRAGAMYHQTHPPHHPHHRPHRLLLLGAALAATGLAIWSLQARHLYYPGLYEHWIGWGGFPAEQTPLGIIIWTMHCWIAVGHYGSTGLGAPLLGLAVVGAVLLARREAATMLLLAGPLLLGWAAALAGHYPMADRTVLYAVPCVWLLAVVGLSEVCRRLPRDAPRLFVLASLALLIQGTLRTGKYLALPTAHVDFRGAFAFLERQRQPDDVLWVCHAEVYEVYHGKDAPCLSASTPPEELTPQVHGRRLWAVVPTGDHWLHRQLRKHLEGLGMRVTRRAPFAGLDVVCWDGD